MAEFKLVQRVTQYESTWIDADDLEAAKKAYETGDGIGSWETDNIDDVELVWIDEKVEATGETVTHDLTEDPVVIATPIDDEDGEMPLKK